MVEKTLQEKRLAEPEKEIAEREPDDIWEIPF